MNFFCLNLYKTGYFFFKTKLSDNLILNFYSTRLCWLHLFIMHPKNSKWKGIMVSGIDPNCPPILYRLDEKEKHVHKFKKQKRRNMKKLVLELKNYNQPPPPPPPPPPLLLPLPQNTNNNNNNYNENFTIITTTNTTNAAAATTTNNNTEMEQDQLILLDDHDCNFANIELDSGSDFGLDFWWEWLWSNNFFLIWKTSMSKA